MKKLTVVAFLAALGLAIAGCGGGGGSSSASAGSAGGSSSGVVKTDSAGFTTETKFITDDGITTDKISEVRSTASSETPPTAPTFARNSGTVKAPTAPIVVVTQE